MNLNKPKGVILLLVWSLFMGVTAISIGVGAIFPSLNGIAQPFICSNGYLQVLLSTSHPQPGVTYTAEKYQCVDNRTGEARDVNQWSMFLINGLIYGTILFAIIMLWWWIRSKRRARLVAARSAVDETNLYTSVDLPPGAYVTSVDKYDLQELTRQYKAGQFSEKEYQRKRKEILDGVAGRITATPSLEMPQVPPAIQSGTLGDYMQQVLTQQYESGVISEQEYERKKAKLAKQFHFSKSAPTSHLEAATSPDAQAADELRKLKKLLDEGLITQQDYDQKKAEILSRM
jgi:hypothetical protein